MSESEPHSDSQMTPQEFMDAVLQADFGAIFSEDEQERLVSFLEQNALDNGKFFIAFNTSDGKIVRVQYSVNPVWDYVHVKPADKIFISDADAERPEELKDIPVWWHGMN